MPPIICGMHSVARRVHSRVCPAAYREKHAPCTQPPARKIKNEKIESVTRYLFTGGSITNCVGKEIYIQTGSMVTYT
jgi:hypothetical protein